LPVSAYDANRRRGLGKGAAASTTARCWSFRRAWPLAVVGLALPFSVQEMPSIPSEPHDVRLDWIVTETGTHDLPAPWREPRETGFPDGGACCFWVIWLGRAGTQRSGRTLADIGRQPPPRFRGGQWRETPRAASALPKDILRQVLGAGADVVTTGNHVFDQREALGVCPRGRNGSSVRSKLS